MADMEREKKTSPNARLVTTAVAYPVIWFALLYISSPPAPWWLLEPVPTLFFVFVVPTCCALGLANARIRGLGVSWFVIAAFSVWMGLVGGFYWYLLDEASGSV